MTLAQFNQLASERLKLSIRFKSHRKLCDFRPAFGDIFGITEMDLDFWGYCDLDIILGDLRHFLTDNVLNRCDVISAASRFMAGPFSVFRNTKLVSNLYRRSKNIEQVMTERQLLGFDELGPHLTWLPSGDFVIDRSKGFESFTDLVLAAAQNRELRAHFGLPYYNDPDIPSLEKGTVLWINGKLKVQSTGEELLLYHFQMGKESFSSWFLPHGDEWRSGLLIAASGFFPPF